VEVPAGGWLGIDVVGRVDGCGESVSADLAGWILRFRIVEPDCCCGSSRQGRLDAEKREDL